MEEDLYATLGVPPEASEEDITKAYRRLSLTYHPDRWHAAEDKQAAGRHWLRIAAAHELLTDEQKKRIAQRNAEADAQESRDR